MYFIIRIPSLLLQRISTFQRMLVPDWKFMHIFRYSTALYLLRPTGRFQGNDKDEIYTRISRISRNYILISNDGGCEVFPSISAEEWGPLSYLNMNNDREKTGTVGRGSEFEELKCIRRKQDVGVSCFILLCRWFRCIIGGDALPKSGLEVNTVNKDQIRLH